MVARVLLGICVLASPWLMQGLFLLAPDYIPFGSSLLMVPALMIAATALFVFLARGSFNLRLLFGTAVVARCACSALFCWMSFVIYESEADSFHYWDKGLVIAEDFRSIGWHAFKPPYWSTNFMFNLTGFITLGIGNALPTMFILFALIGLLGGYFFYRAFTIAFPSADRLSYGYVVMLLPSIMFWSCAIGKDALAQLFVGLAVLGYAKLTRKMAPLPILMYVAGIVGMLAVRPHIAAMLALAGLFPYVLAKNKGGPLTFALKVLAVPILLVGTFVIAKQAARFLGLETGSAKTAVSTVNTLSKGSTGEEAAGSTYGGGAPLPVRVAESPLLIFRPFIFEAHNATSSIAALEGLGLLCFTWVRRRRLWRLIKKHWRHPFVAFALGYSIEFSVAFAAATSNFGTLVRQRIMMVPVLMMLFFAELEDDAPVDARALLRRRLFDATAPRPQTTGAGAD